MQPTPGATPRSYRVPIVVLSVVLFLLVGAIVVVQAGRAGRAANTPCAVGEWDVVSYREAVPVPTFAEAVSFTGGSGTVLRLAADGTGETDYGTKATFAGRAPDGRLVRLEVAGPVRFRYELGTDSISVTPAGNAATSQLFIDDTAYGPPAPVRDEAAEPRSFRLDCAGDALTQEDDRLLVGYRRR
ncbi:hypothetical protein O7635_09825 [Asanoa sp. WMMD1127]|uniref:hypothetical protein n=1 Tax=Asanoa sp. WMMD1127 TaxID=3016107 RepID=UPI002415E5EB|nr:hypothetical protein [Asanoa sp. WMMD1127]MDG4822151.1 hypothetical protein [Asanoa sp. WMMD1127]